MAEQSKYGWRSSRDSGCWAVAYSRRTAAKPGGRLLYGVLLALLLGKYPQHVFVIRRFSKARAAAACMCSFSCNRQGLKTADAAACAHRRKKNRSTSKLLVRASGGQQVYRGLTAVQVVCAQGMITHKSPSLCVRCAQAQALPEGKHL